MHTPLNEFTNYINASSNNRNPSNNLLSYGSKREDAMKFLITGGAGFIGANYLNLMVEKYPEDEFVCLDALTYAGNKDLLTPLMDKKNFKFIKGDIRKRLEMYSLFKEEMFDIVINFAAQSDVDRSIEEPTIFSETNFVGVGILMDACRKYGVKRFHQVSTDEVYGDLPSDRPDLLFTENSPLRPSSPYAASKAAADLMVMAYHRTYNLAVTISRSTNNFGPYQYPEKLIPLMIKKALNNKKLPVYGEGTNIRDWIYVVDNCQAIDLIARNGKDGEIYNVGADNERSNIDVVKTIIKELGKSYLLINHIDDRPGHDKRYGVDSSKLRNELGWQPEYDFDTQLKKTIQWYADNLIWLNSVGK